MQPLKLTASFILLCSSLNTMAQQPVLKVAGADSAKVKLSSYKVDVKVVGNTSITTMEMVFCNKSSRVLEGDLNFPMPDGVSISRYAIDINGKLREAVPVEKEKGQVVFENIERKNVDPGLLEKTSGNNFHTRIYPIPAKGCRTVLIGYEQELKMTNKTALLYDLPLHFKIAIDQFQVSFKIYSTTAPEIGADCSTDLRFSEMKNVYVSETKKTNFRPDGNFAISIPVFPDAAEVLMQQVNGQNYFLVNTFPEAKSVDKIIPSNITILWDASLSGLNRDHQKEIELLDKYFKKKGTLSVKLATTGFRFSNAGTYQVSGGNWSELRSKLENMVYDGGTDFTTLEYRSNTDEYLFFSDGLNTYGNIESMPFANKPVTTINAAPEADYPLLKYIAAKTGGTFINLNEQPVDAAFEHLTHQPLQFIGIKENGSTTSVYPSIVTPVTGSFSLAGICNSNTGNITLQFGYGKTVVLEKTIELDLAKQKTNYISVDKIWAQKKINELETQYETFKDQITNIGKKFGLVTRNTSLIVLDDVADYVKYEIDPPAELKGEYTRLMAIKERKEKLQDKRSLDDAVNYYSKLIHWWNRKFDLSKAVEVKTQELNPDLLEALPQHIVDSIRFNMNTGVAGNTTLDSVRVTAGTGTYSNGTLTYSVNAPTSNFTTNAYLADTPHFAMTTVRASLRSDRRRNNPHQLTERNNGLFRVVTTAVPFLRVDSSARPVRLNYRRNNIQNYQSDSSASHFTFMLGYEPDDSLPIPAYDSIGGNGLAGDINIKNDIPEKPYLKQLDSASATDLYKKYLDLRKDHLDDPVFFFDVAKRFFSNGDTATGLLILSNISDMGFDDHELYKMLGYELKVLHQYDKEIFVYRKVLEWRPQEPQSYRDYGLALADAGKYQQALDTLYLSLSKNFDEEISSLYPGIEEITCTEINNILSKHGTGLNLSKIDKRIIKNLPSDIRVVLNWNMNDTDIDLWVFDPTGDEKCFYGHTETRIGGRISKDFTRGYGPEQFMLKKAIKGKYQVKLNYYGDRQQKIAGPTTVMAEIFTNYGRPNQQSKTIAIQMEKRANGEVMVGEFEF